MTRLILVLALAAMPAPLLASDDEKLALAREIAGYSILAVIGPLQTEAEVEQIIADAPELTSEEQSRLRDIGRQRAMELGNRALEAEAQALAAALSLEDLTAIADYERSPAAANKRSATPAMVAAVMQALGGIDYKAEVRQAFCEEFGKLCQ